MKAENIAIADEPEQVVYKIVDVEGSRLKTLFHGNRGTRRLEYRNWLEAERKLVRDGSAIRRYLSGWHVFRRLADARRYLQKFKNIKPKAIVRCRARGLRSKTHSNSPVLLADQLLVERIVWRASSRA